MPDGAELILSKSSVLSYGACHYRWMLGYVMRVPGVPSLDMAIGTATHAGIETYWRIQTGRQAYELSPEDDAAVSTQTALARELALGVQYEPVEARQGLADGLAMTKAYIAQAAPTFEKPPTLIEADFLIRVDGILVSGRIDTGSEDEVRDTKTTSTPSKVDPDRYGVDMALYAWGARSITGKLPTKFYLDVLGRNGRTAIKEVQPDYAGAAEVVRLVAKGVQSGDFEPTGARTGQCASCAYAAICRFSTV